MTDPTAVAELLERAGRRLTDDAWTQGVIARLESGRATSGGDPAAVRYCAVGAISAECYAAISDPADVQAYKALWTPAAEALVEAIGAAQAAGTLSLRISTWNDDPSRSAADVRERCDRAAAQLRRDAQ